MHIISFLIFINLLSNLHISKEFHLCQDTTKNNVVIIQPKKYLLYNKANSNKVLFDSTRKTINYITNKSYIEEATIFYKQYRFTVKSYFVKDSVNNVERNLFNPVCTKQTISFYRDSKLISMFNYPANTIIQEVSNHRKMKMLEDVINYIGLIKGKQNIYLGITGYGGCNSCSYFNGLFSLNGKALAYEYRTDQKIFKKTGDFYRVFRYTGINRNEYDQYLYSMIKIYLYPPDRSN